LNEGATSGVREDDVAFANSSILEIRIAAVKRSAAPLLAWTQFISGAADHPGVK